MTPAPFDLDDIEHEPTEEQLAALMDAVAEEAQRRGQQTRRELLERLQAGVKENALETRILRRRSKGPRAAGP